MRLAQVLISLRALWAVMAPGSLTGARPLTSVVRRGERPCPCCSGPSGSERGDRAAGSLDLVLGGGREGVGGHLDRRRDLAGAEDLDRVPVADGTLGDQVVDGDLATVGVERAQAVQVDHLE